MHGLPKGFTGDFFVGQSLEMCCFNENQMYLHFGNDISIVVESSFLHRGEAESEDRIVEIPLLSSGNLLRLLGKQVKAVSTSDDGTLCLDFDNGDAFMCFDDQPTYESYQIHNGESVIYV